MIDRNKLRAAWVSKGFTQERVAKEVGVSNKTFSLKMKRGVFGSDEIEKMIDLLDISDPVNVFFAKQVT
jgi:transcriptional regulator, fis family